jgi:hypothetical protein
MNSEIVIYSRSRNISPERISQRSELARSDKRNPSERMTPQGRRANSPISQQDPMSDEELNAQVWLDEQLVKFYHQRNGRWPKLRRLFSRAIGGRRFPNAGNMSQRHATDQVDRMSRIIPGSICGLALAAVAAFAATPLFAAASSAGGSNSPHIVLVRAGGGGGGGGHGGGGFGGGGGHGFSGGGGRGFSGGFAHSFSGASRSFSGNARSFGGNSRGFDHGNRSSFDRGRAGFDGFEHRGWNRGDWVWRGDGGWWGWGYPLVAGLGGYDWWYPGLYGYGRGSYSYDGSGYASIDSGAVPQQLSAAIEPPPQNNQIAWNGQGNRYLDEAVQNFQGGYYQNAIRMAEHAIVDFPRDAEAHEVVALAAFANKDYRTAATEAHAVTALGGVPSWNQVYAIYQNADVYTSQLRSLEDYVRAHPESTESQFLLGVQYLTTGYSSEARDHLAKAAELTPDDKIVRDLMQAAGDAASVTANDGAGTKK